MADMFFDEEGLLDEPCLSCEKARIEYIWWEWYCDEKECIWLNEQLKRYKKESEAEE